ncbi:hypothetical protein J6590_004773 [Homalodisca vitripennis]|nr:hypothetical protein J6590_004773 [Homalodisca vitripennis]
MFSDTGSQLVPLTRVTSQTREEHCEPTCLGPGVMSTCDSESPSLRAGDSRHG